MANERGRGRGSMGQMFGPFTSATGGPQIPGQPVMVRMQGVPTMPGYRDRIPKWNAFLPPILFPVIWDVLQRIIERWRG